MERKKASALAGLLIVILASLPIVAPTSGTNGNHRYYVMWGTLNACTQLGPFPQTAWLTPFQDSSDFLTPNLLWMNITFSEPDANGVVTLTIPNDAYVSVYHEWYDITSGMWFNLQHFTRPEVNGSGWIFTDPDHQGDVDCYVFNNDTGAYWTGNSPEAGNLAAYTGDIPGFGPDGIPGTGDAGDGFGDGSPDPAGSSVLYMLSTTSSEVWTGEAWEPMMSFNWTGIWTTGTAYDIVNEPTSDLDGVNSTMVGFPWEFLASGKPLTYQKWNALVKYASAWSNFGINVTLLGAPTTMNLMLEETSKLVRWDCVILDIDCNQLVNILDVLAACVAFGSRDRKYPNKFEADPNWDPRADVAEPQGIINILDVLGICVEFGNRITAD